ncbi:hypothetical protein SCARD494_07484 [Seiridium cardinale]
MVFPGRFSTGCKRCRQRKVKCDENKPSCRRCTIYGQPCPGYTDRFHFRNQEYAPKQEVTSTQRRRSEDPCATSDSQPQPQPQPQSQLQSQSQDGSSNTAIVQTRPKPPTIPPQPQISYEQVSLCYFIRRFVTPCEADSFPGHLSFLPGLYSDDNDHGLLEVATMSVAQMAAYNQFGGERFRLQSYQNYGRAVRALRNTIQTEDEVTHDRVICTVLLLCMFKDISGEGQGDLREHASGLYYLLEKRGVEQLCSGRGFELFLLSLIKLQVHSFMHQDDSYGDPGGLVSWLSQFDPMMRAVSLMARSLRLRHNLFRWRTGRHEDLLGNDDKSPAHERDDLDETVVSLLRACFEALDEFDSWDLDAGCYWKRAFEGRSAPAALGEVATKAKFYDPETACTIILVRSARLVLLLTILEHYESTRVSSSDTEHGAIDEASAWMECVPILKQNIGSTIDDMLRSVPFAMGDLDANGHPVSMPHDGAAALVILQPIRLVTYCPFATKQQKSNSQDILDRINRAIGVRAATSWGAVNHVCGKGA